MPIELERDEVSTNISQSGTVIVWEAYDVKIMRQVKLIEKKSPHYLDNHNTVQQMIREDQFQDGNSNILHLSNSRSSDTYTNAISCGNKADTKAQLSELNLSPGIV